MATKVENGIRRARNQKGLTQLQLAELLDVDKSTLSKWESGNSVPDIFKARLARIFGVPVHHLFFFDTAQEVRSS